MLLIISPSTKGNTNNRADKMKKYDFISRPISDSFILQMIITQNNAVTGTRVAKE
jgi:hypothetical protein